MYKSDVVFSALYLASLAALIYVLTLLGFNRQLIGLSAVILASVWLWIGILRGGMRGLWIAVGLLPFAILIVLLLAR